MMMSRPQPTGTSKVTPAVTVEAETKPKTTHEAVEDLERRLQMLGEVQAPDLSQETKQDDPPPPFALVPPQEETKAPEAAPKGGGKTALLVSFKYI